MTDIASFQFKDPLASFNEGVNTGNALQNRVATVRAGNALAGGAYGATAGDLYRSGQIPQGASVEAAGQAQQDRALKFTVTAMTRLQDIHRSTGDVNQTLAAFDTLAPQFKQIAGETDADLAQIRQHIAQNPDSTLAALGAGAAKQYQSIQGKDGGIYAFDPGSGTAKTVIEPDATPKADWKEVKNSDGSTRFINLNDPKTWGSTTAPQVASAKASPSATAPVGFDAIYHGFVAPHEGGYTPSDGNGAPANFGINQGANPEVDVKSLTPDAAKTILHDKYWVPSGAENLPPALQAIQFDTAVNMGVGAANGLLAKSGGDPKKYLDLREQRYRAIAAADPSKAASLPNWLARNDDLAHFAANAAGAPAQDAGATAPAATMAAPGQIDMATAEATARALGMAWNPSMMRGDTPNAQAYQAKIAAAAAQAKPGGIPGSAPQVPDWAPDPAKPGYLRNRKTGLTKPDPEVDYRDLPVDPNEVKMLLDGRYPAPTSGRAATDPHWQSLLAAASAADPGFDAANYSSRVAARKDITSGKLSQNITSGNTLMGHLDNLDRHIDQMNNMGPGGFNFGPLNHFNNDAAHYLAHESGTGQRYKPFEQDRTAVASELTRFFRGTGGNEADVVRYIKPLDEASSPQELHTAVQEIVHLMRSRLEAASTQYQRSMGLSKDPVTFLGPAAQTAYQRITGDKITSTGEDAPATAAAPQGPGGDAIAKARDAISKGADPEKVKQRLIQAGINPADL